MTNTHDPRECPHLFNYDMCKHKADWAKENAEKMGFSPTFKPYCPLARGRKSWCPLFAMNKARLRWKGSTVLEAELQRSGRTHRKGVNPGEVRFVTASLAEEMRRDYKAEGIFKQHKAYLSRRALHKNELRAAISALVFFTIMGVALLIYFGGKP